jgi:hypothetical protein
LNAHVYYGLAALVLVGIHGGFAPATPMAWLLWTGTLLVIGTGLWGILTWTRGPAWLTAAERRLGMPFEMAHALDYSLGISLQGALEPLDAETRGLLLSLLRVPAASLAEAMNSALRSLEHDATEERRRSVRDALVLISQKRKVADRLRKLRHVRWYFQGWRSLHVPLAWLFCGVILLHVLAVWWY